MKDTPAFQKGKNENKHASQCIRPFESIRLIREMWGRQRAER